MHHIGFRRCSKKTKSYLATTGQWVCSLSRATDTAKLRSLPETAPFQPFMLLAGDALSGWQGDATLENLDGRGAFNRLALFPNLAQLQDAKFYLQRKTGKGPTAGDGPYWYSRDPLHQFLLLSGKTHFLGMTFRDLKRLQIDIATYCQEDFTFPNAARDRDRITAIAMSDTTGWERLISGKELDEPEMLHALIEEIRALLGKCSDEQRRPMARRGARGEDLHHGRQGACAHDRARPDEGEDDAR